MSLIQQVTPALLESQAVLPDKELNSLYRYIAVQKEINTSFTRNTAYILTWRKGWWLFLDETGNSQPTSEANSILNAILEMEECGFTVYRISNSSL